MGNKTILHSLIHQTVEVAPETIFFKDYTRGPGLKIDRDGLFFSIFNKMFDRYYSSVPNYLVSHFEAFNEQEHFYRLYGKPNATFEANNEIVLIFHLSPLECPLELLSDFLNWFRSKAIEGKKIIAHYHYDVDLQKSADQIYISSFFELIRSQLGSVPEAWTVLQIEKRASFEKVLVIEAGTQWKCLDNYLVHVILSKGGGLYLQKINDHDFEVVNEEELSPFHSLQLLKRRAGLVETCDHYDELKMKNFLQYPNDMRIFYYLIYKNIFRD